CGSLAAGIRSGEEIIFSAKSDGAQRAFRRIMPRTGLCRVRTENGSVLGGSLAFRARDIGITTALQECKQWIGRAKAVRRKARRSRMSEGAFLKLHVRMQV